MKFLSFIFLLAISNATFASGGGGGGSSPFIPLNPPIIVNIMDGKHIRHMQVVIEIKLVDPANSGKKGARREDNSQPWDSMHKSIFSNNCSIVTVIPPKPPNDSVLFNKG